MLRALLACPVIILAHLKPEKQTYYPCESIGIPEPEYRLLHRSLFSQILRAKHNHKPQKQTYCAYESIDIPEPKFRPLHRLWFSSSSQIRWLNTTTLWLFYVPSGFPRDIPEMTTPLHYFLASIQKDYIDFQGFLMNLSLS